MRHFGQRIAAAIRHHVLRQHHRKLVIRHRHIAAVGAVDDRDWTAPVTLTRDAPVAQAELDFWLSQGFALQGNGHAVKGLLEGEAVELVGIEEQAVIGVGGSERYWCLAIHGTNDGFNGQAVLGGERKVAFVVGRYRHDGTFAVAHQHIVGDPYGEPFTREGVLYVVPSSHAGFFLRGKLCLGYTAFFADFDKGLQRGVMGGGLGGQGVLSRHSDISDPHEGVGPGGEYLQHLLGSSLSRYGRGLEGGGVREVDFHSTAFADPVALHGFDLFRPVRQGIEIGQQLFGIRRNAEVVHGNFTFFDQRATAPATPVDHLFIGEYCLVGGIPVDDAVFFVD